MWDVHLLIPYYVNMMYNVLTCFFAPSLTHADHIQHGHDKKLLDHIACESGIKAYASFIFFYFFLLLLVML